MAQAMMHGGTEMGSSDVPDLFAVDFTVLLILRGIWVAGVFTVEVLVSNGPGGPPAVSDGHIESTIYNRGWSWPMCSGNPIWNVQDGSPGHGGGVLSSYVDLVNQVVDLNCGLVMDRLVYRATGSWRLGVLCSRCEPFRTVRGIHWRYDWLPIAWAPLMQSVGPTGVPHHDLHRILYDSRRIIWDGQEEGMVWAGYMDLMEEGEEEAIPQDDVENGEGGDGQVEGLGTMGMNLDEDCAVVGGPSATNFPTTPELWGGMVEDETLNSEEEW